MPQILGNLIKPQIVRPITANVKPLDNVKSELHLSDKCVQRLKVITKDNPASFLRVAVEGGGCSGFQYTFNLDSKLNDDDK